MTTTAAFRKSALALPHALEKAHFDRAGFRVDAPKGKMFCTLAPDEKTVNLQLTRDQQDMLCAAEPDMFQPIPNKWGEKGWTVMTLSKTDKTTLASALRMAWMNAAPEKLHTLLETP